jgi:galactokinase
MKNKKDEYSALGKYGSGDLDLSAVTFKKIRAISPGRVNLIGDHTDYTGGLVLPMTINRETILEGYRQEGPVELRSEYETDPAIVPLDIENPADIQPDWARYVAGVVKEMRPTLGLRATITTTIPVGAGLSSSASLELAVALALGFSGTPTELALLGQKAEHEASGVPCGIMDQLSIAAGDARGATLIDCHELTVTPVTLPEDLDVVVVYGHHRTLAGSEYGARVHECAQAEASIGPLRLAELGDLVRISDPGVRARARHVVSENQRVRDFAKAIEANDRIMAGKLMLESHTSLRDDFQTSTPKMDALVEKLCAQTGVWGARITGGGFGGCVVALAEHGAIESNEAENIWVVRPSAGARIESL